MIDAELGKKLACPSCAVKFYDLGKVPAVCPKCGTVFTAEPILPSKEDRPPATETEAEKDPKEVTEAKDEDEATIVSLEDIVEDDSDDDDDEMAAIKDVDLGDDDKDATPSGEDDDSFLEVEDGDASNVSDIVGAAPGNDEE